MAACYHLPVPWPQLRLPASSRSRDVAIWISTESGHIIVLGAVSLPLAVHRHRHRHRHRTSPSNIAIEHRDLRT
jgi:hypothetical protein